MQRWYYRDDHHKYGPLTSKQLRAAARANRLQPHHLVSQDGKTWFNAERVKGLFSAPPDAKPPSSSPAASRPGLAPTEQWDIGSSTDLHKQDETSSKVEPTERWDIAAGSSASGGSHSGGSSASGSDSGGGSSDAYDIFEEPGSAGSSISARAGATMVVRGLSPGALLGNYEILETLGEGGMGTVLKARHIRMDRLVALKVLRTQSTKPSGAVKRFHQEVRAASRLSHPNIVTAFDADEVSGVHFLVMEFVEGCDLDDLLAKKNKVPFEEAAGYILQAAQGLAFAHSEGVIHRDIKPGNLMLDKRNIIKILDMGLASVKQTATEQARHQESEHLTQADQLLGTFDYMSPEQAVDARSADHRADVYSLGCTLFKLVTGQPPYRATTTMEKILAHREQAVPMMSKICPEIPFDLDAVFGKMVAKDSAARYQSMDEVVADLNACLKSEPISAWQTGSWGESAPDGSSQAHLSDEKLRIEPRKQESEDDLDEYMLSPLDDEKVASQPKQQPHDTAEFQKQETKEVTPRWFWRVMGEVVGPLTLEELKERNINTWDDVRREDSEQWVVAQDVKELFD